MKFEWKYDIPMIACIINLANYFVSKSAVTANICIFIFNPSVSLHYSLNCCFYLFIFRPFSLLMLRLRLQESPLPEWLMRLFRRLWVLISVVFWSTAQFSWAGFVMKFILLLFMASVIFFTGCCIEGFWSSPRHKCQQ